MAWATSILVIARQVQRAAPAVQQEDLVVVGLEADARAADVVGDQEIDALGAELAGGVRRTSLVSAAKPTRKAPALPPASSFRMSGFGASSRVSPSSLRDLILVALGSLDAVVGDGGGLDDDGGAVEVMERGLAHLLGGLHRHEDGARQAA